MRKFLAVIVSIVILAIAGFIAYSLFFKEKPKMKMRTYVTPVVYVQPVENTKMALEIFVNGNIVAKNKIKLFSEVQGVLKYGSREFKTGVRFRKGDLIYKLNSDEFYANLLAQKSLFQNQIAGLLPDLRLDFPDAFLQWEKYLSNFEINGSLGKLPEPTSDKEKLFITAKNIYSTYYSIKNLEIKLAKYSIYAPFNGVLTEANITLGSLVSPGQAIGEFVDPTIYEMEVAINSSLHEKLNIGDKVEVENLENENNKYLGRIARINEKVDLTSQTVKVFIELKGEGLKEGMYLKANIKSKEIENIIEVPRNLLIDQNKLYVVNDTVLHLVSIKMVHQNENSIMVEGLKNKQLLLTKPVPKAFEGMKVEIYKEKE